MYREVVPPERLIYVFIFDLEGIRDHESVVTLTLDDLHGRTKVTSRTRFAPVEDLEGAHASGMTQGAAESFDRLATDLANG